MDHEEAVDLVAIYALGALPRSECDDLRAHLRCCLACCWEALVFTEAAAVLAKAELHRRREPPEGDR